MKVVHEGWEGYLAETDEGPMVVSFDLEAASEDLTSTLKTCVRVQLPVQKPNELGAPVSPEAELLWKLEDDLCAELVAKQVPCRLVGRLTHGGQRELVFQLDDERAFAGVLAPWQKKYPAYKVELERHEGWEFFDEVVRPSPEDWIHIGDRQVVDQLVESGSDPSQPHALQSIFQGPEESLRKVANELVGRGYQPLGDPDFASGEVVYAIELPLDVPLIVEHSIANSEIAEQLGAHCDGWGATVSEAAVAADEG